MLTGTNIIRKLQQENIRLQTESTSLNKKLIKAQDCIQSLVDLQQNLASIRPDTNVFKLINQVLKNAMNAVNSENGSLALLDEKTGELVFVEVLGLERDKLLNLKLPPGEGIAHWCIKNKLPKLVEDIRREPKFSRAIEDLSITDLTSVLCIPLIYDGRPLGTIEVINNKSGEVFNERDKEIMVLAGQLAAMIIASAEKLQE